MRNIKGMCMKKFILTLIIIMFSCLSANATSQVFYTNTSKPSHISYGTRPIRSIDNFGYNAEFLPQNNPYYRRPHYRYNRRFAQPAKCCARPRSAYKYAHNHDIINYRTKQRKIATTQRVQSIPRKNTQTISRFDKNYRITHTPKISTNGVIFYKY